MPDMRRMAAASERRGRERCLVATTRPRATPCHTPPRHGCGRALVVVMAATAETAERHIDDRCCVARSDLRPPPAPAPRQGQGDEEGGGVPTKELGDGRGVIEHAMDQPLHLKEAKLPRGVPHVRTKHRVVAERGEPRIDAGIQSAHHAFKRARRGAKPSDARCERGGKPSHDRVLGGREHIVGGADAEYAVVGRVGRAKGVA